MTLKRNFEGKIMFPKNDIIGDLGEDFVRRMVRANPKERASAMESMNHSFLTAQEGDDVMLVLPANAISQEDH
jgi:serine/threonine protein kinase